MNMLSGLKSKSLFSSEEMVMLSTLFFLLFTTLSEMSVEPPTDIFEGTFVDIKSTDSLLTLTSIGNVISSY